MDYPPTVALSRLDFSDGFKFYGPDTVVTPSATVNLPVPEIRHLASGMVLEDGQVLDGGTSSSITVPNPQLPGWATPAGSRVRGWSYDIAATVTASGKPSVLWTATVRPTNNIETITPGAGTVSSGSSGGASTTAAGILPAAETPSESLARWVDYGTGSHRIAVAGDSIWNDGGDPPRKLLLWLKDRVSTSKYLRELQWNTTSNAYNAPISVQAGEPTTGTGGTVLTDNFNRTVADLKGTTTSGGQVWAGTTSAWSANGTHAVASSGLALSYDTKSKDIDVTTTGTVTTVTSGQQSLFQVIVSSSGDTLGDNMVFAQVRVSDTGVPGFMVYKRFGGVSTQIGASNYSTGLSGNSATPQSFTVRVQVAIQQVTATLTVNGTDHVISGTITEGEVPTLGGWSGLKLAGDLSKFAVDNITMATPYVPGEVAGLEILNAAVPGTALSYQTSRVAAMYPSATRIDSLLISGGHNNGVETPEEFVAMVDAFVTAFQAAHPETKIVVASENPQFAPATTVEAHARRQAALRGYAMENGFEYLPIFEAFRNQSDGGASYVQSDGVHPTVSSPTISLGWSGATLMAAVWFNAINARRQVGTSPAITALP